MKRKLTGKKVIIFILCLLLAVSVLPAAGLSEAPVFAAENGHFVLAEENAEDQNETDPYEAGFGETDPDEPVPGGGESFTEEETPGEIETPGEEETSGEIETPSDEPPTEEPPTTEEPEEETPAAEEPAGPSYLFLGNSKTYYNNLPEMYAGIVKAGTGDQIRYDYVTYASRTEAEHGAAVKAVLRTKGKPDKLKSSEKKFFTKFGVTYDINFNQKIYNQYKSALINKDGSVKKFDYIVIQLYSADLSYDRRIKGVLNILRGLSDPNTRVILTMSHYILNEGETALQLAARQARQDEIADQLCKDVAASVDCKSVTAAYYGRAACNYLIYFGGKPAIKEASSEFTIYKKTEQQRPVINDLIICDRNHPTQLGTYLFASTLYGAVYGRNASSTVSAFRAKTETCLINANTLGEGQNFAVKNGPIDEPGILMRAANAAYDTQCKNWNLPMSIPEMKSATKVSNGVTVTWKSVSGVKKYRLYKKTGKGKWKKLTDVKGLSYIDKEVKNGKKYSYAVCCLTEDGEQVLSEHEDPGKTVLPLETPVLTGTQTVKKGIQIEWDEVTGADKYIVYRKTSGNEWEKVGSSGKNKYVDKKITTGVRYNYTVCAVAADGSKSLYDLKGVSGMSVSGIENLVAQGIRRGLKLRWKKPEGSFHGYEIAYSRQKDFGYGVKKVIIKKNNRRSLKIKKLKRRKVYYVRVRTYRKVKGITYYSPWSKAKKVRIK